MVRGQHARSPKVREDGEVWRSSREKLYEFVSTNVNLLNAGGGEGVHSLEHMP